MKKKNLVLLLTGIMGASLMAGCSSSSESKETQKTEAGNETVTDAGTDAGTEGEKERTTFTVGFDAEFPPYGYKNDKGEYVGFDLSLADEVCKRNGWELVKQPIDWDFKDKELSSGAIDCIWNGFTMNGREDDYTWSEPYVDNSQVFVVGKDSGIAKKDDLAGKVVAVQKESSALAALEDEENKALMDSFENLNQYADYNTAFMDLEAGAVDCVAMDIGVAQYQIKNRDDNFIILDEYLSSEKYGIGFEKGNEELRDDVQNTLNEMLKDGTFAKIAEDWGLSDCVCLGK